LILQPWAIGSTFIVNVGLAIALEVGIFLSAKNNGFHVSPDNVFAPVSPQFLLSFFPTLLVIPVAFLWREMDWMVRWYHPFVILSRGHASASETLLLDYIAAGVAYGAGIAAKFKHWIVFSSALTAIASYIFQPLAGAIFRLEQHPASDDTYTTTAVKTVGLLPQEQLDTLTAFVAAAGFTEAAKYNGLPDPPFITGGWAAAEFKLPDFYTVNGSVVVHVPGIQTTANCAIPGVPVQLVPSQGNNNSLTLSATSAGENCAASVTLDPTDAEEQFGVQDVPCGDERVKADFHRVMFWFFHMDQNNKPEAQAVFCHPTISSFDVELTMNVTNKNITDVKKLGEYTLSNNNVTSGDFAGKAYNGVIFDTANKSFIIQARAAAIQSGLPGTIYRAATLVPDGIDSVFKDTNGFLNLIVPIYTQHLSVAGKSVYFVAADPDQRPLQATLVSSVQRLVVDPLAGHTLAFFLLAIAIAGLVIQFKHHAARRTLYLTSPPGSMATVISLASRSGFGELLLPYDDEKTLKKKLAGLRFRLDSRTGAIVVDESVMEKVGLSPGGRQEAMRSLLGGHVYDERSRDGSVHDQYASSAQARESALSMTLVSYPPATPLRTPFDAER
jgi:hypothetical protein